MIYAKEINGVIKEIKLPNRYNGIENVQNGYATRIHLHELDGFIELVKPLINSDTEKYGNIILENNKYHYEVISLTAEQKETKEYLNNQIARITEMCPSFDFQYGSVSNVAIKSVKVYNENSGLKESTTYLDYENNIVAIKKFSKFNKGTKLVIDFYDKNNEVIETIETLDYYSEYQITKHDEKCTKRVSDILLWKNRNI
tara:strand:+ start:1873 stop:2472 length:600 start_codon:yes stop_codon:yes gene_type:complete